MTFLFDIGKVLLDFDFEGTLEPLLPAGADASVLDSFLADKDAFERGDIGHEAYLAQALGVLDPSVTREAFESAWRNVFTPNRPMWGAVESLAADGHRLLLFSNTNAIHCPWMLEEYDVFRLFEAGTYSFEVGCVKPEPEIYHRVIADHGLDPATTRYIDDLPANVEAGRALGFRTHHYDLEEHAAFDRWLEAERAVTR